ncbi:hypothetical protein [Nostoc sp.]|uniref:hypothetical protein n=1 Tax=Nostoc sp. TaxID=1180 RepID=UPI002FFC99B3
MKDIFMPINSWTKVAVIQEHLDVLPSKKIFGVIEVKIWYLQKDSARKYDIIEQFILRCIRDLTPIPSAQEISHLLGFVNDKIVLQVYQNLETKIVNILFYEDAKNATKNWEIFDYQQKEINPLLREAVILSGIETKYECYFE